MKSITLFLSCVDPHRCEHMHMWVIDTFVEGEEDNIENYYKQTMYYR